MKNSCSLHTLNRASFRAAKSGSALTRLVSQVCVWSALAFPLTGCHREDNPPPLSRDQVTNEVSTAFKDAAGDAKGAADEVVNAIQNKDESKAFLNLRNLESRPDLTPEQRSAASRAASALHDQLRESAAQGDAKAQEALEVYRASK